jgi:hypothetical protein
LEEKIGGGGMGSVYRARHRRLDRTVALKFLGEPLGARRDLQERVEAEARAMARLDHPNIVAVYDAGRAEGHGYIAMEFVDGEPLSELIPLPLKRTLEVADQICQALSYAHARGVVHCDVKPQNVLVDAKGQAKVTDFGIARVLGPPPLPDVLAWRRVSGTQAYMAPEALRGEAVNPRMDVFSLGVVVYQMLTGRLPTAREPLTGPLASVVRKALCPDPEGRYADAGEMRRDLLRVARSAALTETEPSVARWVRAAALCLALAAGVATHAFSLAVHQPVGVSADFWVLLRVALIAIAGAATLIHVLDRRWHAESRVAASSDYVPLDSNRVPAWTAIALVALALSWLLPGEAPPWALRTSRVLRDLLALLALARALTVLIDLRRAGGSLGPYLPLVALGALPALVPPITSFVAWLARLASS